MHPARQAILDSVKRVREGNEPHQHAPFARHTMRIPLQDFEALKRLYPGLDNYKDPAAMTAAWEAFERSPFSEPYRVGKIVRGIVKNGVIGKPGTYGS
jgi:hypothetical protein